MCNKTFDEKINAYSFFFEEMVGGFAEINEIFERMGAKTEYLVETYGGLVEDEDAGEPVNAQLSQLRIMWRDFTDFMAKYMASIADLRDSLASKIEFAAAMLEAIDAEQGDSL
jgi:hypothetical protein